MGIVGLGAW